MSNKYLFIRDRLEEMKDTQNMRHRSELVPGFSIVSMAMGNKVLPASWPRMHRKCRPSKHLIEIPHCSAHPFMYHGTLYQFVMSLVIISCHTHFGVLFKYDLCTIAFDDFHEVVA